MPQIRSIRGPAALIRAAAGASFIRFLCVGVVNTLIGYGVNFLLYNFVFWGFGSADYWLSTFLANACGAAVSYFLNRRFTFRSRAEVWSSVLKFAGVILACYLIAYSLAQKLLTIAFTAWKLPLGARLEGNLIILAGMVVYTLLNYFGQKLLVFRS